LEENTFEGLGELSRRGLLPVQGEQELPVHGSRFLRLDLSHEADGDWTSKNEPNGDEVVYILGVQPWYEPVVSLVVCAFNIQYMPMSHSCPWSQKRFLKKVCQEPI
jgi:hypothetical protein